jgi:hypothetical protein
VYHVCFKTFLTWLKIEKLSTAIFLQLLYHCLLIRNLLNWLSQYHSHFWWWAPQWRRCCCRHERWNWREEFWNCVVEVAVGPISCFYNVCYYFRIVIALSSIELLSFGTELRFQENRTIYSANTRLSVYATLNLKVVMYFRYLKHTDYHLFIPKKVHRFKIKCIDTFVKNVYSDSFAHPECKWYSKNYIYGPMIRYFHHRTPLILLKRHSKLCDRYCIRVTTRSAFRGTVPKTYVKSRVPQFAWNVPQISFFIIYSTILNFRI